jgi:hypothetical protein
MLLGIAAIAALLVIGSGAAASGGQLPSREEALALVFPGASVRAEQVFLTPDQQHRAAAEGRVDVRSPLIARYEATRDGVPAGRAYVDTHVVRTKKESLLVSLDPQGRVKRIDVVAFLEPEEYRAPAAFLNQYAGRPLSEDLQLQRAVRPIAGATLTARAVNDAVRRVLAIDRVLTNDRGDRSR